MRTSSEHEPDDADPRDVVVARRTEIDFTELIAEAEAKAERLYAEWLATGQPMDRI
jgi:hypothetical protein